jgi:coenzyme F420-reducing hydrogenase delta subunit
MTSELQENSIILGERNYEAALNTLIASAQDELLIFDQHFERGNYASLQRFEAIQAFLSKNDLSKLTIILQSTEYFIQHCPRLFDLLKLYGHKMVVYETNDNAKIAKDCFVIADKQNYLRRFHIDQARFKFALNDVEECANLSMRFDELLDETTDAVSSTKLGL